MVAEAPYGLLHGMVHCLEYYQMSELSKRETLYSFLSIPLLLYANYNSDMTLSLKQVMVMNTRSC